MPRNHAKGPTDADLANFLTALAEWDGANPSFQDLLLDAAAHAAALKERHKDDTTFVRGLAAQTNLAQSLIRKWVAGHNLPDPSMARIVVNEIRIFLTRRRVPPGKRPN